MACFSHRERATRTIPSSIQTECFPRRIGAQKFTTFVEGLRLDLGEADLPILFAQLGNYTGSTPLPAWDIVKQEQAAVNLPGVVMIATDDLPISADAHFGTESNVEIGRRFAASFPAVWR
jgi:hypothetical protein